MPWTNEPPLPSASARQGLAAATADAPAPGYGYRIYAIGGNDSTSPIATVVAYDTLAGSWSNIAPMSAPREGLAATSGPGRLYALGGDNGSSPLATHEIYDPAADGWSPAPALPTARTFLAAVTGRDGLIYTLGGYNGAYLNTVEAFDPTTNAWNTTPIQGMPTPRSGLAAVIGPDGLIYAIGGQNDDGYLDTVEIFDPGTSHWATGPSIPDARYGLAAAVGPDGLIYAIGGIDENGEPQGTVYSYDPTTNGPWVTQSSLLTAQALLAAVTGPDGLIYAIGGQNFTSPALNTVEAFTVATTETAPDPYIGNGTYQSPDIILLGFVYNPGERVLGSTTPLYTLLLALTALLHLDAEAVGKGLNILADGMTCLLIVRLMACPEIDRPVAGLFAALLYAVSSTPISISISGMETALVTCAGMAAILAYVEGRTRPLLLLAALLFLLRIDTLALSGLLVGAHLLGTHRLAWRDLALALLLTLPWIVFATVYFGSPIPTSLIAKLTVYRGAQGASHADILNAFAVQFAVGWFQRIVTLLFAIGGASILRSGIRLPGEASLAPTKQRAGADRGAACGALFAPTEIRAQEAPSLPRPAPLLVPLLWLLLYYGTMLVSHVPAFAWYFLPPWPLLLCVAALGGQSVLAAIERLRLQKEQVGDEHRGILALFIARDWMPALALFGLFGLLHLRTVRAEIASAQTLEDTVREPLGLWLREHAGPHERILLEPIGTIGYYSRRPILDMIGLVSPEVFPSYRTRAPLADIVRRFHPDWLCFRPGEVTLLQQQDPAVLSRDYRLAEDFHAPGRPTAFRLYHNVVR